MKTILTNCSVIDCSGQPPMKDMSIIIEDDKIVELKAGLYNQTPSEGERILDLEGGACPPGSMGCACPFG